MTEDYIYSLITEKGKSLLTIAANVVVDRKLILKGNGFVDDEATYTAIETHLDALIEKGLIEVCDEYKTQAKIFKTYKRIYSKCQL